MQGQRGSMNGRPINELNAGLVTFRDELLADSLALSQSGGVPEPDGVGLKAGHQFACPSADRSALMTSVAGLK